MRTRKLKWNDVPLSQLKLNLISFRANLLCSILETRLRSLLEPTSLAVACAVLPGVTTPSDGTNVLLEWHIILLNTLLPSPTPGSHARYVASHLYPLDPPRQQKVQ